MPRWPEKNPEEKPIDPEAKQGDDFTGLLPDAPTLLPLSENALHDKIDHLIQLTEAHVAQMAPAEVESSQQSIKLKRRRTEDEMRYALRVFANGLPRQRDDDCEDVINDAIGEVLALRQVVLDLMQSSATAHQNGLAAIRKMTER